jgi:DNA helicase-2/ATP-dependent DNA helicase PcrA
MAKGKLKATLIIAGPGAGKTHNMVSSIIKALPELSPVRYIAVITYTNAAANNILLRVSKQISIPENLFIGTMHSFLNRFIVMPFASYGSEQVGREKIFLQCDLDTVFLKVESLKEKEKRTKTPQAAAVLKKAIREKLNKKGYITFDQTLSIAKDCVSKKAIGKALSNRLQFLFVDEFQDSGNDVFSIIENIRKQQKTIIYCVGDPEQYIQSFDSSIKTFHNIPILKAAESNNYDIEINNKNFRSSEKIVKFLNKFNGRYFRSAIFQQQSVCKQGKEGSEIGEDVLFSPKWGTVTPVIEDFYRTCDNLNIPMAGRCILAKKNDVINRITSSVNNNFMDPKKEPGISPIKAIQDTLLSTIQMNQTEFCDHYQATVYTLRKYSLSILKAINNGRITNENTYGSFVKDELKLDMVKGLPVKIDNLKIDFNNQHIGNVVTICNIHTIKGLESEAVLVIAKTEQELLLWIETDPAVRELKRDNEKTDYPRLGYVAFSRAEKMLCIACLEKVSASTLSKLTELDVKLLE